MTRSTAVLIIGYNRPEKVEAKLRLLEPIFKDELIISIDGDTNRDASLSQKWMNVRALFPNLSWMFRQENLGLARHVTGSISEVLRDFQNCIIIEDDVEVSASFLCQLRQVLATRLPENVLTVGSFGGLPRLWPFLKLIKNRWRLSRYFSAWGWAIQREDWTHFSLDLVNRNSFDLTRAIHENFSGHKRKVWMRRAQVVSSNQYATWDFQVFFLGLLLNKKHMLPTFRSSDNVGFMDSRSTNTKHKKPFWYTGRRATDFESLGVPKESPKYSKSLQFVDSLTWAGDSYLNRLIQLVHWVKGKIK